MMHIDLEQLDRELGLEEDPLDEFDELELLAEFAGELHLDLARLDELRAFTGISGIAIVYPDDQDRGNAVRKCKDCDNPARPRKSPNGPWPQRCEECTKKRKRFMDSGGSKAREPYKPCCVQWQLDPHPSHRGLCQQCRDARMESRKPVSQREAGWLARTLGPSGWNIQKAGWLQE